MVENGATAYTVIGENEITAIGNINWQVYIDFDYYPSSEPTTLIKTEEFILTYKSSRTVSQIAVLDKNTGELLWQDSTNIKSNLAVSNDQLFFLSNDTKLWAIDLRTGKKFGYVAFHPGLQNSPGENTSVQVATDKKQVLVYFASTHQLFSFEYSY